MNGTLAVSPKHPTLKLSKAELEPFCGRRDGIALATCVAVVAGLIAAFALHAHFGSWVTFVVAFVLMGGFQHHLSVIHHEAIHYLLFRSRRWNDLVGRFLGAYPIGFTMAYRATHLSHHRRLGEDDDPDLPNYRDFPATAKFLVQAVLRDVSALSAILQAGRMSNVKTSMSRSEVRRWRRERIEFAAVQLALMLGFVLIGHAFWYLSLWILPLLTWTKLLTHWRNVAEHLEVSDHPEAIPRWRTLRCNRIEGFFVAPLNFNYHAEHHLYPQVPFYHLPALHRRLMREPLYAPQIDVRNGYVRFLYSHAWVRPEPVDDRGRGCCVA